MSKSLLVSLFAALSFVSCAGDVTVETGGDAEGRSSSALSVVDDESVIGRQGDGLFRNQTGMEVVNTPSGPSRRVYADWGYWVDLKVKNLTYEKYVGIIWTQDGWATWHVTQAQYEYGLGGEYEQWGIDLTGRSYSGAPPTIEYAAFTEQGEIRYYGKQGNSQNYVLRP